jgi:hypothetical protein
MHHIQRTFTERVAGGFYVDFVVLKNGKCIGISEEGITVYPTYGTFYVSQYVTGAIINDNDLPQINFKE